MREETSNHLRAKTKECQLLDNLVDQLLELWGAGSGSEEGRPMLGTRLAVVDRILPEFRRQREEDLRIGLGEAHSGVDRLQIALGV
jgi:hypothetical protein